MKKILITLGAIAVILFGIILVQNILTDEKDETETTEETRQFPEIINEGTTTTDNDPMPVTTYTMTEVALHNNEADCWFVINNKVYNVTTFSPDHPGGDTILSGCGLDATNLFNTKQGSGVPHSADAQDALGAFYIGDLSN